MTRHDMTRHDMTRHHTRPDHTRPHQTHPLHSTPLTQPRSPPSFCVGPLTTSPRLSSLLGCLSSKMVFSSHPCHCSGFFRILMFLCIFIFVSIFIFIVISTCLCAFPPAIVASPKKVFWPLITFRCNLLPNPNTILNQFIYSAIGAQREPIKRYFLVN